MRLATCFFFLALLSLSGDTLPEILARMNADAPKFQGVTAQMTRTEYTAPPVDDTTTETGLLTMIKLKGNIVALLDIAAPDAKQYLFKDNHLQEFLPKISEIHEYDLGKDSGMVSQFVTLGFGGSGKDLEKNYTITMPQAAGEVLKIAGKDVKVTKLQLVPRAAKALEIITKIDFFVQDGTSYAVELKVYEPSKSTNTAIYSDVVVNPPELNEHSVELKGAKAAKKVKIN